MVELHAPGTRKFEPWPCPKCGYVMDAASHPTEDGLLPDEGDLAICLQCAEPFVLENDRWRLITDDELIAMPLEHKKTLSKMQAMVRLFNETGLGPKQRP